MHAERVFLDAFRDHTVNRQDRVSVVIAYFMQLHIKPRSNEELKP